MGIETLVVTVDQKDLSLIKNMNIQTDTIVGNQTDCRREVEEEICGCNVIGIFRDDRGVGLNRNRVLARATAEYCVLADDDMRFVDGYPEIVEQAFRESDDADVLIFNLIEKTPKRHINTEFREVHWYDYGKYGAARYAVKRKSIVDANIRFSLLFGGGAKYSAGEDSIFLKACLDQKLKVVAVPYAIAEIDQEAKSTWFDGFNRKYFHDRGALYACLYSVFSPVYCMVLLCKHRNKFRKYMPLYQAFYYMIRGIWDYFTDTDSACMEKGQDDAV